MSVIFYILAINITIIEFKIFVIKIKIIQIIKQISSFYF